MGLSIAEASYKMTAEIKNKFENEFSTTQTIDATVEYLKEHADYGKEEKRTGKIDIPAYYSFDVEIRQLVYRCYGVEAQTDIVDTFTDDPVKLENVFEREQQLKEAVGIKDDYC
uniref:Uncharacterized protein n=1 Tax=Ditylenchus dipsaci TaxID=166011 RepID=A0A915DDY5_9BILA